MQHIILYVLNIMRERDKKSCSYMYFKLLNWMMAHSRIINEYLVHGYSFRQFRFFFRSKYKAWYTDPVKQINNYAK